MAKIRSVDTKPELLVRRTLHAAGYRYRLHDSRLPGRPDLVFPARHKVIFVHGCFWHAHDCPVGTRVPKTNTQFWLEKRLHNRERDSVQLAQLPNKRVAIPGCLGMRSVRTGTFRALALFSWLTP
ncbi:very short patch repair endonuclease [Paenarthrobacter ureafaciens]